MRWLGNKNGFAQGG